MEIRSVWVSGGKKQGHRKSSVWWFWGRGAVSLGQVGTLSPVAQPLARLSNRGASLPGSGHHSLHPQRPLLPSYSCLDLLPVCDTQGPGTEPSLKFNLYFQTFCLCCSSVLNPLPLSPLDLLGLLKLSPNFLLPRLFLDCVLHGGWDLGKRVCFFILGAENLQVHLVHL